MKKLIFRFGILLLLAPVGISVPGQPRGKQLVKNYSLTNLGSMGGATWAVIKDKRGLVYVGGEEAIHEFDGTSWRKIELPNKSVIRSLAIDQNQVIYVGGVGEFGYLAPDNNGKLVYVSLIPKVPETKRSFPDVWSINILNDQVIFQAANRLFGFRNGQVTTWEVNDSYHRSFVINKRFYINQNQVGLCYMIHDSLVPLPGGEFFMDKMVSSLNEFGDRKLLIGTRMHGLYLYDYSSTGRASVSPVNSQTSEFLKENHLYHGVELPENRYAFTTLRKGTIITDAEGNILNYINTFSGSSDFSSYFLYLSNESELWITSARGLSQYNINSPLTYMNWEMGLYGTSRCVSEHRGMIFVGTSSGLFHMDYPDTEYLDPDDYVNRFDKVKNLDAEVWDLLRFDPTGRFQDDDEIQLLAATQKGLYNVDRQRIEFLTDRVGILRLCQSRLNPSILYFSTHPTFYVLQKRDNGWQVLWEKDISSYVHSIAEDADGNVWLGTMYFGVFRVGFDKVFRDERNRLSGHLGSPAFDAISIENFTSQHGLPNTNKTTTHIYKGRLIVSCEGFFEFDKENGRFIRSDIFGEAGLKWNKTVDDLEEDPYGNVWGLNTEIFDRQPDGQFQIIRLPYKMLTLSGATTFYFHDGKGATWIAGENGLLRYDTKKVRPIRTEEFATLIRKVSFHNDSVLYYGTGYSGEIGKKTTAVEQPAGWIPEFEHRKNTISFEFSCPYYQDDIQPEYSYMLEGYDKEWSAWTTSTHKDYQNLFEGTYTFRVRARNYSGEISEEGYYQFIVKPPLYRTLLMKILYVVAFILILYLGIRIYGYRLKKHNVHLEQLVEERTSAVMNQKEKIDRQAQKLKAQNEKLVQQRNNLSAMSKEILRSNQEKLKFFTNISHEIRTPLTLILGPAEELIDQEKDLNDKDRKYKLDVIYKNASRLLTLVDQIMDFRKLEIQNTLLKSSEGNIVRFVGDIVSCFTSLADKMQIELQFQPEVKSIITWFDRDKIEKILSNLLSNAFKYTEEEGGVTVAIGTALSELPGLGNVKSVRVSVTDTGIGIEEEILPYIFDRFYHSGSFVSLDQAGSGIGLSMARSLAEIHHGKIEVSSVLGQGSEFVLFIPFGEEYLKEDEKERDDDPDALYSYAEKTRINIIRSMNIATRKKKTEVTRESDKPLVLVVEDSEDIRSYIMSSLKNSYEFIEAENGMEALDLAMKYNPDMIITDILMPEMDGYEFCSRIKHTLEISHIPVVMLTAKSGDESRQKGLETGADAYITKPFNLKLLETQINNLIQSRDRMKERFRKELVYKPADIVITSTDEKFLSRAIEVVEKNIANPEFDVISFSHDMAMSQSTLYRKLKAITGESTNNFIKEIRLKRAATILSQNELSISEVSFMVGYDDPAYFAKSFKQKFKSSPSEYAKVDHQDDR